MNKLISIVVPIYNASKYLKDCVLSALKQDYEYFELILVDDGSKDNSLELCNELAKKDKRIKVIHQENGGVSKARNTGIENASGDYLTFIDSDDLVEQNHLSILLSHMEENTKMVVTNYKHLAKDGSLSINVGGSFKSGFYSFDEMKDNAIDDGTLSISPLGTCWTILFDLSIIKDNKIRFVEGLKMGEDGLFTMTYFYVAKSGVYLDLEASSYLYRDNDSSSTYTMSIEEINGKDKAEELLFNSFSSIVPIESLNKQLDRRRVTAFITHMIFLARSKNLSYKFFKLYYKSKKIHHSIKSLNLNNMKKNKKVFIYLLKLRLVFLTYILFKIKYGR